MWLRVSSPLLKSPQLQENLPNNTNVISILINRCIWDKIWRDFNRFWWNLVRVEMIEDWGKWGFLIWENRVDKWIEEGRFVGFYFQVFKVMLRHELKTRGWSTVFMPQHKEGMSRHVALRNLYGNWACRGMRKPCRSMTLVQTAFYSPEITKNQRVMHCMTKTLSNLLN